MASVDGIPLALAPLYNLISRKRTNRGDVRREMIIELSARSTAAVSPNLVLSWPFASRCYKLSGIRISREASSTN